MITKEFSTKQEVDIYLAEQKIRQEQGCLSKSERVELQGLLVHPETLIKKEINNSKIKHIITNIGELRKPCLPVEKGENINQIIQELKETLIARKGFGLSANQIGYNKSVCYLRIPTVNLKTKKIEHAEFVAINPKIIEKERKIIFKQEGCLSIKGLRIDTDRYVFCTIQYENEKREIQNVLAQDLAAFIWQHEYDHLIGITILDRKHKRK